MRDVGQWDQKKSQSDSASVLVRGYQEAEEEVAEVEEEEERGGGEMVHIRGCAKGIDSIHYTIVEIFL